jgi:hypothetical protein
LIRTPGGANRAGVIFGLSKPKTTRRIGRKNGEIEPWQHDLDPGIAPYVKVLHENGVETFESCDGGPGHAMPEPTIRFHGERPEGFRALAVARTYNMPVGELRRFWPIIDGEPTGPYWAMTFYLPSEARRSQ